MTGSTASAPPHPSQVASLRAPGERAVYATAAAVFAAAALLTLHYVDTMSGGMPMPGGWTMSMMWMAMPGQTALDAAVMFVVMWVAMMVAMMLPSALPMLLVYRRVVRFRGDSRVALRTWLVGAGYFLVWTAFGVGAYVFGLAIARSTMASDEASRLVPLASGLALAVAGAYQLTPWKSACLEHCRDPLHLVARHLGGGPTGAFRLGLHHGAFCAGCCWALMLMQLMIGVMSLAAMVAVAVVIAAEKLLARGEWIARLVGVAAMAAGAAVVVSSASS